MQIFWLALLALIPQVSARNYPAKRTYDTHDYYVVEHQVSFGASLSDVAQSLGVEIVEQAGELADHWLVRILKLSLDLEARGMDPVIDAYNNLRAQAEGRLVSRSEEEYDFVRRVYSSIAYLDKQVLRQLEKRAPPPIPPPPKSAVVAQKYGINDPLFPLQWHLANDKYPEHMMNVTPVWDMGYTGKGVISSLIDDGLDYTSEDLAANFDAADSYDFNDHVPLPYPKNARDHHGTRCGGQIAAGKNKACGIGIAYESKIAGLRILSKPISQVDEAAALNYGYQNVSIYSCSWGPRDDGRHMQGPHYLVRKAVVNGINNGRGGKGSIFVFASGNGAHRGDQCNFDGYTNSIYSVTVSAVDHKGLHPKYSEACAANMITAYSSGSGQHIVTTDKGKSKCAMNHGGTSAAAPNVVGVFALALQARPDLTWRDIQYLCIETARQINPKDRDWERMASGRYYSYKYGFGVLDASLYVQAARTWKLVKPQAWIETETIQLEEGAMDYEAEYDGGTDIGAGGVTSKIKITKEDMVKHNLESLEHINVRVWIDHTKRGDVEVELVSPSGIKSILAAARSKDDSKTGFPGWSFMTVKHWGENPIGDWTIRVSDQRKEDQNGAFLGWNMVLWGTTIDPSKAKKFVAPHVDNLLPPNRNDTVTPGRPTIPTTTTESLTQHSKPTAALPSDHGTADGENTKPAFPGQQDSEDKGWLADLSLSHSKQKWLIGAIAALILVNLGGAAYYWRRQLGFGNDAKYNALPGNEELPLANINQGGSGRRLYDVIEEDEEENSALAPAPQVQAKSQSHPQARSTGGLGFHSGFLDDDDPSTAGGLTPKYRDEPDTATITREPPSRRDISPEDSEDGIVWEDAR